jgi:hypothetical protein
MPVNTPFHVRRVAVLGAGVMGAQIAARLVNANVAALKKLEPSPLSVLSKASCIGVANCDRHLPLPGECDLVIEAFAGQALAVKRELTLDHAKVNPLGGAIALGHPLGATGAVRAATLLHGMRRHRKKYGMIGMCIGTGMGAAGVFESL